MQFFSTWWLCRVALVLINLCAIVNSKAQTFVHPGILHTNDDFTRIKNKIAANEEPWASAYKLFKGDAASDKNYALRGPVDSVQRDKNGLTGYTLFIRDAAAAYNNAVMWMLTGDSAYAQKSVQIMNAWSHTLTTLYGSDMTLGAGQIGFRWVNAAEIIRYSYPGWATADIQQFETMLKTIFVPWINVDADANWGGGCLKAMMGIGIFCNDTAIYNAALNGFYNFECSSLSKIISASGQNSESGRDQIHAQINIGHLAEVAWVGKNQGLDLFGALDNRILRGFEYQSKFMLGNDDVPWDASVHRCTMGPWSAIAQSRSIDEMCPMYEMVYNYYTRIKQVSAPFTTMAAQTTRIEGKYSKNYDGEHLTGWGTLLFTLEEVSGLTAQAITSFPTIQKSWGDADFDPGATASSGLQVYYSSSNPNVATIVNNKIHIKNSGFTQITAYQPGDSIYKPAVKVTQAMTINSPSPYQRFEAENYSTSVGVNLTATTDTDGGQNLKDIATNDYVIYNNIDFGTTGATRFYLRYTTPNTGVKVYLRSGSATGPLLGTLPVHTTGSWLVYNTDSCKIDPSLAKGKLDLYLVFEGSLDINWFVFDSAAVSYSSQTIQFPDLPDTLDANAADVTLGAVASSGLAVTYTSSNTGVASIKNGALHLEGPGEVSITASQAGDWTYNAAADTVQKLVVTGVKAGTYVSSGTMSWSGGTWNIANGSGGYSGTAVAAPADSVNVIILSGHTVTLPNSVASKCKNLLVQQGATLIEGTTGSGSLTVYGNTVINGVVTGWTHNAQGDMVVAGTFNMGTLNTQKNVYISSTGYIKGAGVANGSVQTINFGGASPVITIDGQLGGAYAGATGESIRVYATATGTTTFTGTGKAFLARFQTTQVAEQTIVMDINMNFNSNQYGANGFSLMSSGTSAANKTFTVNAGKTLKLSNAGCGFHNTANATYNSGNHGNFTYNINGTLDVSVAPLVLYSSTNTISPTQYQQLFINVGATGLLKLGANVRMLKAQTGQTVAVHVADGGVVDASTYALNLTGTTPAANGSSADDIVWFNLEPGAIYKGLATANTATPFWIGSSESYNPVTITPAVRAIYQVQLRNENTPAMEGANFSAAIHRTWEITTDTPSLANLSFGFNDTDVNDSCNTELAMQLYRYHVAVAAWEKTGTTVNPEIGITTDKTVSFTGVDTFSSFTFANAAVRLLPLQKQVVTLQQLAPALVGDTAIALTATASSGLPLRFVSSNSQVASIVNGKLYMVGAGTALITAIQDGNEVYDTASAGMVITGLAGLSVWYRDGDNGDTGNNTIRPYIALQNGTTAAVDYSGLTARYWLTPENYSGINAWIDYAQIGNNNVQVSYVPLTNPRQGAFGYLEYRFVGSGVLAAGGNSGPVQSRVSNTSYGVLQEGDDFSYQLGSSYAANEHITLYRNGYLVWGTEPAAADSLLTLQVQYANGNSAANTNTIRTTLVLANTGNIAVPYSDISLKYWFTNEGSQSLNYWIDYAAKGAGNFSARLVKLDTALMNADTYLELTPLSSAGVLYPLSNSGNIQYRVAKSDWTLFDESNDYSYLPLAPLAANNKITVYYQGRLVYGIEPAAGSAVLRTSTLSTSSTPAKVTDAFTGVSVYPNPSPGNVQVRVSHPENGKITISVLNATGASVYNTTGVKNGDYLATLPMHGLPAGMYLVKIAVGSYALVKKVLLQ